MTLAPSFLRLFDLALGSVRRVADAIIRTRPVAVTGRPAPKARCTRDLDRDRVMLARAFEGRLSAHLRRDIGEDGR